MCRFPRSLSVLVRPRPGSIPVLALAALFGTATSASAQECPTGADVTAGLSLPMSAVRYLADDALEGRGAGTAGERCAGDYIAAEFDRIGLAPGGTDGTWFQEVGLASAINPHAPGGTGRNVIGVLDGADPERRNEWVVIGAHYDHLGLGGPGSLTPGEPAIHNGADDNASGVAAMLAAADALAHRERPARSIAFVAFTGEELGLLGSAEYASHPPGPIVGMINLDMVGRLGDGPLIVYGVDTATEWNGLVATAAEAAAVAVATRGEGYGPSDHTSFYLRDVPVLHLFTNTHGDYHKPSDDWQTIDGPGLARVTSIVIDVARAAADRDERLTLVRGAGEPPRAAASGGGYGAWLGTVPDFTPVDRGVKLGGVTAGSPADRGGLRAGDIVLAIGEHDVPDLQGMTDALRARKPGETVEVRVGRGDEIVTATVTLGSRADR